MANNSKWPGIKAGVSRATDQLGSKIGNRIRNEQITRILRGEKTGRTYGRHTASAPGQSPASDTGRLVNSIRVDRLGPGRYRVVAGTKYARMLEYGTSRMAARPFARPAAAAVRRELPSIAKDFKIRVG